MKILIISPRYYPYIGGVEYVVKSIAERLVRQGYKVTVLAGERDIKHPIYDKVNMVEVIRWPINSLIKGFDAPKLNEKELSNIVEFVKEYDIIHIHNVHSIFSVYMGLNIVRMRIDSTIVVTPHYHGGGHTLLRNVLWILWKRQVYSLLKKAVVHAVSSYEAKILKSHFNVEAIIIEHGVDEIIFRYRWKPENYIMYSGRIEKYKNIERLAAIVKIINKEYGYSFHLKIYGEGPYKKKLIKKLSKIGIEYSIDGFQPREKYLEALSRAQLFALLSNKEAFGQVVNEANAIGVPVVVAKPWGEIFKNRNRVFVIDLKENDIKIANLIVKFIERVHDEPLYKVPSWDDVVQKIIKLYKNAITSTNNNNKHYTYNTDFL